MREYSSTFRTLPIWTRRESSMKTTLRSGHRSSSSPFFSSSLEGVAAFFRSVQTQQGDDYTVFIRTTEISSLVYSEHHHLENTAVNFLPQLLF